MSKKAIFLTGMAILTLLLFGFLSNQATKPEITPLSKKWEKTIPFQEIPKGISGLDAAHCGICHPKHYEEWKISTHAHAWRDKQFQAEIKKETSPFMCINCHIPLQNQQAEIVIGLEEGDIYRPVRKKNPKFDRELQQEGITCAVCHIRNNAIISTSKSGKAPHQTLVRPNLLSEELCIHCHNAVATITPQLVCSFETGTEWKRGPYSGKKNCINCHFKKTVRENATGFGVKTSHLHSLPGSGIPKELGYQPDMLNGLSIQPEGIKDRYKKGDSLNVRLKVTNEFAGHKVPTGDPERFFLFHFLIRNEKDDTIAIKTERIGEKWQWYPVAKKLEDNNLSPEEERIFTFSPLLDKRGRYTLSILVTKHRMTAEAANFNHLDENYPKFIPIFEENFEFEVQN